MEGSSRSRSFGTAHQGAADGEHLLLAAGHGAGLLLDTFFEAREEVEDAVHVLRAPEAIVPVVGAHLQVFEDRHAVEDLAPLRALGDALGDHVVGGTPWISSPAKMILPSLGGRIPWMERRVVVLPAPLEPMRVTTSPSSTVSEIPRRAWMCP